MLGVPEVLKRPTRLLGVATRRENLQAHLREVPLHRGGLLLRDETDHLDDGGPRIAPRYVTAAIALVLALLLVWALTR